MLEYLTRIYKLLITYPKDEIILWGYDISSAFRWVKLNPDIAPVFEFSVVVVILIPIVQNFGSNTSHLNREVLSRT